MKILIIACICGSVSLSAQERCRGLALKNEILKNSEQLLDADFVRAVQVVAWDFRPCHNNWCRCDLPGFECDLKAVILDKLSEKNLFVYGVLDK